MRMMIVLATAAIAVSGVGATASAAPSPAVGAPGQKQNDRDKIICKSERFVGSHMSERICKSRAEWAESTDRNKRWLDKNNGTLFNDQLIKGEGGGKHIEPLSPPR